MEEMFFCAQPKSPLAPLLFPFENLIVPALLVFLTQFFSVHENPLR